MDKQLFERNLLALSQTDPALCARLSSAVTTGGVYRFIESRSGESIPALTDPGGAAHPLHSTVDPRKEGERLVSTLNEEGYIIFLGLGGAFAAEAALMRGETKKVLAVEYNCNGIAELLSSRDYINIFKDPRFRLLADPSGECLEEYLLNSYFPVLDGGIRVFPLRARAGGDSRFGAAGDAIKRAINAVSRDYSVQAYFGKRWFCNIIRNLPLAEKQNRGLPPVRRAAVCAAGPSLDIQLPLIKKERGVFLIAADTSLPALLHAGIEPDGVVSIDCQHISYRHFFTALPEKTILFLDLSSPPPVAARSENRFFFSGAHPLGVYIRHTWRPLPALDTSGANVTYAAFSLAESLGAEEITFYGADFSYPGGKTYARGTYIYPYFENLQSRFLPLEAQHSAFLYRDSLLQKCAITEKDPPGSSPGWYYETRSLRFYRETLNQKAASAAAAVRGAGGFGVPEILYPCGEARKPGAETAKFHSRRLSIFSSGPVRESAAAFLREYKQAVEKLRSFDVLDGSGNAEEAELAATLLPLAAAIRKEYPFADSGELFKKVRSFALKELSLIKEMMIVP